MKISGTKLKMTQIFREEEMIPVTLIQVDQSDKLEEGKLVKVRGKSKGKGFQGVVKRWGFRGGPQTHGQKDRLRAPGSIGSTAPQRVIAGRKMAGRTGGQNITVKNLRVVTVDKERKLLFLKGAVPGVKGGVLEIWTEE